MKTKFLALSLSAFAVVAFAVHGQNSTADESGHIVALETAWNHALEVKDTAALQMLLANNMIALDSDGTLMNKAAYLAGIKTPDYQPGQVTHEKINVHTFGDTAVVSGVYREEKCRKREACRAPVFVCGYLGETRRDLAMRGEHCGDDPTGSQTKRWRQQLPASRV